MPLRELRDLVERDYILKKLEEHDWNITQAAQALGVERTNLHKKIKQHGLSRAGRGGRPLAGRRRRGRRRGVATATSRPIPRRRL